VLFSRLALTSERSGDTSWMLRAPLPSDRSEPYPLPFDLGRLKLVVFDLDSAGFWRSILSQRHRVLKSVSRHILRLEITRPARRRHKKINDQMRPEAMIPGKGRSHMNKNPTSGHHLGAGLPMLVQAAMVSTQWGQTWPLARRKGFPCNGPVRMRQRSRFSLLYSKTQQSDEVR
jgi:hypothetical protein